jgi:multidrug transporter EmrE-like cation transporter
MPTHIGLLAAFCTMQLACTVLFKFGSTAPSRWVPSFVVANLIGVSSTWMLMLLYRHLHANVAMGLGVGISFMLGQVALALLFRTGLSAVQSAGVALVTLGLVLLSFGAKT